MFYFCESITVTKAASTTLKKICFGSVIFDLHKRIRFLNTFDCKNIEIVIFIEHIIYYIINKINKFFFASKTGSLIFFGCKFCAASLTYELMNLKKKEQKYFNRCKKTKCLRLEINK